MALPSIPCSICATPINLNEQVEWWRLGSPSDAAHYVCSLSCLTELAWTLRSTQEKLSKSKEIPSGAL